MNRPRLGLRARVALIVAAVAIVVVVVIAARGWRRSDAAADVPVEAVARRDIAQTVEATGTVQPVEIVEIRSKASGQILRMPVQLGSVVRTGDVLAQIDTVNVQNQYDEAQAALQAATASASIAAAQKQRADELFTRAVITTDQHETAVLALANAQSALVRARSDLEIARQALDDATVRAPSNGTIIEQDVTKGQVIASATSSASGGTLLLKMADLGRIQMEALVGETDIGSVRPGMPASVTVDAFPNRPFPGQVLKIEPQAVVQQSVTMFPVLVTITNEQGLLLPGMNGEVTIDIARRTGVLAVPLDAVRTAREVPTVATALGLDPDSAQAEVKRQIAARMAARGSGGDSAHAGGGAGFGVRGDSSRAGRGGGGWGGGGNAGDRGAWAGRAGRGGAGGMRGGAGGDSARSGGFGGGSGRGGQAQVVFVQGDHGLEPRLVRLGVSDFDYAEVLSGLKEGDSVALVSVAEIQAKRQQDQSRLRQRMSGALPGVGGGGGGGAARGAGAGAARGGGR